MASSATTVAKQVQRKLYTLVLVLDNAVPRRVLLGMKKRGFGAGRFNGFGGKVEKGETIAAAAERELKEEAGIDAIDAKPVGLIEFEFVGKPTMLQVHVFRATKFTGTVTETEEMAPQWFGVDDIPFLDMWPDDHAWFPRMLDNKPFRGFFRFEGMSKVINSRLCSVAEATLSSYIASADKAHSESSTPGSYLGLEFPWPAGAAAGLEPEPAEDPLQKPEFVEFLKAFAARHSGETVQPKAPPQAAAAAVAVALDEEEVGESK